MLMTMEPTQPAGEKPDQSSRPPYQILLVSDDAIFIEAVALAIRGGGHVPTIVSSGDEALRCVHSQHYDLIASKFDLPRMNGEELASWGKALLSTQPFLFGMKERGHSD